MNAQAPIVGPSAEKRIAELDRLVAEREADGDNPWLARAIREAVQRSLEASLQGPFAHEEMAQVLLSGLTGTALLAELWRRFPSIRRADVYAAAALAVTLLQTDIVLAQFNHAIGSSSPSERE
jgi:hypothetical protein